MVGITSLALTKTDLPDPDDPKTIPDAVLRSLWRSSVITLLDS